MHRIYRISFTVSSGNMSIQVQDVCSGSLLAVVNQIFLSARRSRELKDQSEKPQSGRRLIEQEKHQEKKELITKSKQRDVDG